jgi:hypothetical protein
VNEIFKPIGDALEAIKLKFIGWFLKNPFFQKLFGVGGKAFLDCFLAVKTITTILAIKEAVTSFITTLAALGTPAGWVTFVVNLICGWHNLKSAIDSLKAAWNTVNNPPTKYNNYGKMAGFIVRAVGGMTD